jgi:hypothetical protein
MTQGGALGYLLTPLQGSQDEAAASLPLHFFKNVQSSGFFPAFPSLLATMVTFFRRNDGVSKHSIDLGSSHPKATTTTDSHPFFQLRPCTQREFSQVF